MKKNNLTTTININNDLYNEFKTLCVGKRFYLKDLVERAMYLFVNDEKYRTSISDFNIPVLSEESQLTPISIVSGSNSTNGTL
jgi:hypothetical protein